MISEILENKDDEEAPGGVLPAPVSGPVTVQHAVDHASVPKSAGHSGRIGEIHVHADG